MISSIFPTSWNHLVSTPLSSKTHHKSILLFLSLLNHVSFLTCHNKIFIFTTPVKAHISRLQQPILPKPMFSYQSSCYLTSKHLPFLLCFSLLFFLFFWAPKSLQMVTAAMKLKDACSLEGKLWSKLDSIFKSRDITLPTKLRLVKAMVFPVVMYGCENWTVKKAECQRIDAFELWCWRTLESPLECKEIKPIHPKWDQSWVFIGRTDAEAEAPVLWPPYVKSWLIWKDPDAGKD